MAQEDRRQSPGTRQRIAGSSWRRRAGAAAGAAAMAAVLIWGLSELNPPRPWFGGYVDVTLSPAHPFELGAVRGAPPGGKSAVLSFIVADPVRSCTPSWGTRFSLDEAADQLDLDARIARFQEDGGSLAVSFGGALNDELATACTGQEQLEAAYRQVLDRYRIETVDLDIEAHNLADEAGGERRARAIAQLQAERLAAGGDLAVWVTLPAAPDGLTGPGLAAVSQLLEAGVELAGVNLMTMNYGALRPEGESMLDASLRAAEAAHAQLSGLYSRAGPDDGAGPDGRQLWRKIGLTPLIGRNEVPGDVFDLEAARGLNAFARDREIGRISMWSLNRDAACGPDAAMATASPTCSGIEQPAGEFSRLLSEGTSPLPAP